jgi:Coenzyme PQQ synthesis protein D (PqqD)
MTTLEGGLPIPSPNVLAAELSDGESVLLDLNSESYFGLNRLGTAVWSALADGAPLEPLVTAESAATGVPAADIRSDVRALLEDLESRGLIIKA